MSISFLKGSRTKYRILLEKELEKGRILIQEATKEQYEIHFFSKRLSNCISRLNDIIEKLEQTDEKLSVVVDGRDGAQEVEQLITEDWSYISEVVDSRYELEDIQQTLQVQRTSQENVSSRYVKENKFNQVLQLTAQMQNILICQQQLQQQQLKLVELSDEGCYRGQDRGPLEHCYMPQDSVGAEDCENFEGSTGGRDCYMPQDSIGPEDCENFEGSTGGRDCYMPQDSVGAEDCDNFEDSTGRTDCENSKDFMDYHSFKISIGDEESFSCKNNDTDSKHCKDEKKGGYFNTKEGYKSREDNSGFEGCDRGKILRKDNDTEICTNHYVK